MTDEKEPKKQYKIQHYIKVSLALIMKKLGITEDEIRNAMEQFDEEPHFVDAEGKELNKLSKEGVPPRKYPKGRKGANQHTRRTKTNMELVLSPRDE